MVSGGSWEEEKKLSLLCDQIKTREVLKGEGVLRLLDDIGCKMVKCAL